MDEKRKLVDAVHAHDAKPGETAEVEAAWKSASPDERREALDDLMMDTLLVDSAQRKATTRTTASWLVPAALAAAALLVVGGAVRQFMGHGASEARPVLSGDFAAYSADGRRIDAGAFARGSCIEAGAGGAELKIEGRFDLSLGPRARLTWLGGKSDEVMALDSGTLGSKVVPGQGRFAVRTPCGEISVLGTEFMTTVDYPPGVGFGEGNRMDRDTLRKSAQVSVMVLAGVVAYHFDGHSGKLAAGESGSFAATQAAEAKAAPAPAPEPPKPAPAVPEPAKPAPPKPEPVDMAHASTVTLDVKDAKLSDVLAEVAKQTGNKEIEVGAVAAAKPLTVKLDKTPYWDALVKICKAEGLTWTVEGDAGGLTLVPAPDQEEKLCIAGPLVFRLAAVGPPPDDLKVPGKVRVSVEFFWEDRLVMNSFNPATVTKATDAAGADLGEVRGVDMTLGKMHTMGSRSGQRLEIAGPAFSGQFSILLPKPDRGDAFGEISGTMGLMKAGPKMELRIPDALAEGEKSVEREGYNLTIKKVERRQGSVTLVTEFTRDGERVALPWPGRAGWSLVDKDGKAIEGHLMAGTVAIFPMLAEAEGGYTLVREYCPDAAVGVYKFKFEGVAIPR